MAEAVPRFCILGGGLSGLASAFFLQRSFPHARICVVAQSHACGGHIRSVRGARGQVFEQGFHSSILVNKNGRETLGLVRLLGLEEDVISANIEASARRYLFHHGRVQLFPRVPHMLRYGPALLAEPLWPRSSADDESVHEFVSRRTSTAVADRLADPVCRGQLAGDARRLSVRTCFPRLWFNEQRFRSVFVGAMLSTLLAYKRRSWLSLDLFDPLLQRVSAGGRCYSFRGGLSMLVKRLEERLCMPPVGTRPAEILTGVSVKKLHRAGSAALPTAEVELDDGRLITADTIIATIPPHILGHTLASSGLDVPCVDVPDSSLCKLLCSIAHESVTVVNVGFNSDVLKGRIHGAGYFCGSLEQEPILGMSFDSQLFPQHSGPGEARLTAYLGGHDGAPAREGETEDLVMGVLRRHLGLDQDPAEVFTTTWSAAAPQYMVRHQQLMRALDAGRVAHLPWLQVAGTGYFGPRSAADEVVDARELTDALSRRFARFPGLVENETVEDVAGRYAGGFDTN